MNHEEIKLEVEERKEPLEELQNIADLEELFQDNVSEGIPEQDQILMEEGEHRIEDEGAEEEADPNLLTQQLQWE